tara:strand:- start:1130 stop:1414 length:285 start_codon:yes stop_codon:yes gene_type:complete
MITAENNPVDSKGIKIKFLLYNKVVLEFMHRLETYTPTQDDINVHVARCCNFVKGTTEEYIQDRFEGDEIMSVLNVHKLLNKVQTPSGKLVWRT